MSLANTGARATPMDYEIRHMGWKARRDYNERCLRRATSTGRAVCAAHHGLYGLFVPVRQGQRTVGVLQTGIFLKSVPSDEALLGIWRSMRGRDAGSEDEAFPDFVQAILELPVLDAEILATLTRFLEHYAAAFAGGPEAAGALQAMERLYDETLYQKGWSRRWADAVVHWRKLRRPPDAHGNIGEAYRVELGVRRFPTTAMVVGHQSAETGWRGWLAEARFQRVAFAVAARVEESIACALGHHAVLLLTSAPPGLAPAAELAALKKIAADFVRELRRRGGFQVRIGVGNPVREWGGLRESLDQAVLALRGGESPEGVILYTDLPAPVRNPVPLRRLSRRLAQEIVQNGSRVLRGRAHPWAQEILGSSEGRLEEVRACLQDALTRLLEAVEDFRAMDDRALLRLDSDSRRRLSAATDLDGLLNAFEIQAANLADRLERPAKGERDSRLRLAREAIESAPEVDWTLTTLARRFGFSPSVFSREFTRLVGVNYAVHLRRQRIEKAKQLMAEGKLPLAQVARNSGFRTRNYFFQVFKKETGITPSQFRDHLKQDLVDR